jgi:hypothetical protein
VRYRVLKKLSKFCSKPDNKLKTVFPIQNPKNSPNSHVTSLPTSPTTPQFLQSRVRAREKKVKTNMK